MDDEYHCFKENQPCEKGKGILASQLYAFIEENENLFTTNSEVINQNNINLAATDFLQIDSDNEDNKIVDILSL